MKKFVLLTGRVERATEGSAGFDLFYDSPKGKPFVLRAGKRAKFPTGVRTTFDKTLVALFKEKSGLADEHGIEVKAGVIDGDYPDEWMVILKNAGDQDFTITPGMKICQVLLMDLPKLDMQAAAGAEIALKNAKRTGGFGSTGK